MSVLLPVRDAADHLPAAADSLSAQTFHDFEVIVVDDGSRDETPRLLDRWARRDDRVKVLSGPRRGIARALDAALERSRSPLVARMDADDIALPDRILSQVTAMESDPELDLLGTHVRLFPRGAALSDGMRRYEAWLSSLTTHEEILKDLFIESPLCHPTVMARREVLRRVGGYRDIDGPEDYDLWLRLASAGATMRNLPEVLLRWRDRADRATRRDRRYREQAIVSLKLRHLLSWRLGGRRRVGIWGAGPFGKGWARRLIRHDIDVAFFVDVSPRKIGQRIHGAVVIAPDQLPPPGETPLLVAVGVDGARELIRAELDARGYDGSTDVVCVQ